MVVGEQPCCLESVPSLLSVIDTVSAPRPYWHLTSSPLLNADSLQVISPGAGVEIPLTFVVWNRQERKARSPRGYLGLLLKCVFVCMYVCMYVCVCVCVCVYYKNYWLWASLVAQWLRICLPRQGTWVWALVREDPTQWGAFKPVCHNYWACALEPASHNYWAHALQLLKPAGLEPALHNKRSHRNEKPAHRNKE